jgi:deoxyribose-phosphate aldolase
VIHQVRRVVITREHVISKNWQALYDETKAMRAKCGDALLKVILAVGELPTLRDVYKVSQCVTMHHLSIERTAYSGCCACNGRLGESGDDDGRR